MRAEEGAAAGLLCVAPSSWGAGCLCKRVCCCFQKPQSPGEVVTRLLMRRSRGTRLRKERVLSAPGCLQESGCPPRRRAPVSQPRALPSAARQRPTLRPDCSNNQKAHHCLKQRLRLGWGQDLGTLSSRPVSAPVCCPLTSKGTQVALFMALTCGRGQCPQPPGCPPPHGGACSRLRRVGGAVTEGRDTFQVAHSS